MMSAMSSATRLVLLQCPIDGIRQVHVLPGAPTLEQAAGMTPAMILRLSPTTAKPSSMRVNHNASA
jgi:hypothetical protein